MLLSVVLKATCSCLQSYILRVSVLRRQSVISDGAFCQSISHRLNLRSSAVTSSWLCDRFQLLHLLHKVSQAVMVLLASTLKVWYWCDYDKRKNVKGWTSSWQPRTTDDILVHILLTCWYSRGICCSVLDENIHDLLNHIDTRSSVEQLSCKQ